MRGTNFSGRTDLCRTLRIQMSPDSVRQSAGPGNWGVCEANTVTVSPRRHCCWRPEPAGGKHPSLVVHWIP